MKSSSIEQSEFNEAISFLNRLNYIFYSLTVAKTERDLETWSIGLQNLFLELINDIKEKEQNEFKQGIKRLIDDVNKYNSRKMNTGNVNIKPELYWQLVDYEIKLRQIYNRAGYQTKRKDDATKALR